MFFCSSSFRGIAFVSETVVIGSIDNTLLLIHQNFLSWCVVVELGVPLTRANRGANNQYENYQKGQAAKAAYHLRGFVRGKQLMNEDAWR